MNQAIEENVGNFSSPSSYADEAILASYGLKPGEDVKIPFGFGRYTKDVSFDPTGLARFFNRDLYAQYYNAQVDRVNNATEAEKARAWQKMMSDTAFQRQMEDLKAAGINPLYMFMGSGSGASTPSGASSSYSSSINPKSKDISKILSSLIIGMARIIASSL